MTEIAERAPASADAEITPEQAGEFVERFAARWSEPSPERLGELLQPDARLIQPLIEPYEGMERFREEFARLFALIPDLRGEVEHWGHGGDRIYIELALRGTLGGRPVELRTCDRIRLREGRVAERMAFLDPVPLLLAVLSRPRAWRRWWLSGVGPPRRRRRVG